MSNFKIDSHYYNEHTLELELYVGDAIYITLCYDKHPNDMEIGEVIEEIETEQNEFYKLLNN